MKSVDPDGLTDQRQPAISVLCVTHGRQELLLQCIDSCFRQSYSNKEVIIVFNPTDPNTEDIVRSRFPEVRTLKTDRNIGFFPALNLAMTESESDYLMIVDDDSYFLQDDALETLIDAFEVEPGLGAVTCTLEGPREKPPDVDDRYISVFTTGFTMFPRKAITDWVGYFPELFFRSAGETFLCTQLWEQRRPVKRLANVRMFHALALEGRSLRDWRFYGLRSQLLCAVMREPLAWLGPVLLSKLIKSFSQFLGYRQIGLWGAAWFSFLLHLPEAIHQRKPISNATRAFLRFLDKTKVTNLNNLAEWRNLARANADR